MFASTNLVTAAAVPQQKELADQIQAQEGRLTRLQFSFKIPAWTGTAADLEKHDPGKAPVKYTGEYAVEPTQAHEYLRLDPTELHFVTEFLRQGGRWLDLRPSAPGAADSWVKVTRDLPGDLNTIDGQLARQAGYSHVDTLTLSEAVRTAEDIEIVPEKLAGQDTLRVTLFVRIPAELEVNGEKHVGKKAGLYRAWLSRQHALLPVRLEELNIEPRGNIADWNLRILLPNAHPVRIEFQDQLEEASPGIWLPRQITIGVPSPTEKRAVLQLRLENLAINEKAKVKIALPIPLRTPVQDEIQNLRYPWVFPSPATRP